MEAQMEALRNLAQHTLDSAEEPDSGDEQVPQPPVSRIEHVKLAQEFIEEIS